MGLIINPYQFGVPLLLDTYSGAAVAYSLRKLRTAYSGSCIRVRRSSDSSEQDIGFVSNVLDTTSLLTFCGAGNGFIVTWYDQSGSANNATQGTASKQPRIVSSGTTDTDTGKPCMVFDGADDTFTLGTTLLAGAADNSSVFITQKRSDTAFTGFTFSNGSVSARPYTFLIYNDGRSYQANRAIYKDIAANPTTRQLITSFNIANGGNGVLTAFLNSVAQTMGSDNTSARTVDFTTLGMNGLYDFPKGNIQEAIFYQADKTSDRVAIETNINTYYAIY